MRDRNKPINRKPETPSLRESANLTDEIFKKLTQESIFPRRSRWVMAHKIADLANDYMDAVVEANDPKVQTKALRDRRYTLQQIAIGKLSALDVKLSQAVRVFNLNPDEFEVISGKINECSKLLASWVESDVKRYGPPSEAELYRG